MKKNIIALAVAAAVAAPAAAFADATVYGQMNIYAGQHNNGDKSTMAVDSLDSRLGFKGSEDLGNGLSAIYQIEMDLDGDNKPYKTDPAGGQPGMGKGQIALQGGLRNTYVGLAGNFGAVILGKHDTPYKITGRKFELFGDTVGDFRALTNISKQEARVDNVIAYKMPTMSGFNLLAAYVTPDQVDQSEPVATEDLNKAGAWSVNADWANDMFLVAGAYQHVDKNHPVSANAIGFNNTDGWDAYRIGGQFKMAGFKVNALYNDVKAKSVGGGDDVKFTSYVLGLAWSTGPHTIKGQYVDHKTDDGASPDAKATQYALGYDYAMSKKTTAYVVYSSVDNKDGESATIWNGPSAAADGTEFKDPNSFGVGLKVKF